MIQIINNFLGCALFLFVCTSFALPEDKSQILELKAGTADINQETHEGIYSKNVELDQGTTHLRADNAITKTNKTNRLSEAIVKGNTQQQAHFWTLTHLDKPPFHAYANIIRYFPDKHLIVLEGNARVEQGRDSFSAPKISYDTLHKHVVSSSKGQGQTIIIFHPEKKT